MMPDEPSGEHMHTNGASGRKKPGGRDIKRAITLSMPDRGFKHGAERAREVTQQGRRGDAKRTGGASISLL